MVLTSLLAGAAALADAPTARPTESETIVVTAPRAPDSAIGDIPPEVTLNAQEVQSLGASSVAEIIGLLSPQTRSGQGRGGEAPVVLLGGRRISSFAEVRDLPPEAVSRVEILPEEVALKYGYGANQRVVNIVLVDRFKAITGELEPRFATGIRRNDFNTEFNLTRISKGNRFSLDLQYQTAQALTEARGGITGSGTEAPFRTLLPETGQFTSNAVWAIPLSRRTTATLNGRLDILDSTAGLGSNGTGQSPLQQRRRTVTSHAGITLGGDFSRWRWSATGNYDRIEGRTLTQTTRPADDRATSTAETAAADVTINGPLTTIPAGPVSLSFSTGAQAIRLNSLTFRAATGTATPGRSARDLATGRVNLDIPLASRKRGFLGAIGELSVNGNILVQHLSDFGTLTTRGFGGRWEPAKPISFLVSVTDEDGPPSPPQLANPQISTPDVRVFDYSRGETATVTQLDGGNAALRADSRHVFKAETTLKPFDKADLSLTASYVRSTIRNPISAFPAITPQLEAAFPGRITRDASGRLTFVDSRPLNFASSDRSEVRWGVNFSRSLGRDTTVTGSRLPGAARGGFGGGGPGGGGGRNFGATGSRMSVSLYHTIHLTDRTTLRSGLAPLDLLSGAAIGNRGGQPRHEVELTGSASRNGIGIRLNGVWQSATSVSSPDGSAARNLRFGPLATLNFRLFAFPAQRPGVAEKSPWLKGIRFLLAIDNVFDSRQHVTDGAGAVPQRYQPGYLDPLGRTIRISIRKTFF